METGGRGRCVVLTAVALILVSLIGRPIEAATLDVKLHAGDYQFLPAPDNRERIAMPEFGHLSDPGRANLPSKIFLVAIPPGVKVDSVSLVPDSTVPIDGTHRIAPAAMVAPLSASPEQLDQLKWEYDRKVADAEALDEPYPGRVAEYLGPGGYRKYNLVQIRFTPFSYRAQSGSLSFHPSVAVTVNYSASAALATEAGLMAADNTPEAEARARDMIANYDQIQASYPVSPAVEQGVENGVTTDTSTGFVIVTTDALEAAVEPLVNWEKCKGRMVYVRTVEDIEATYSGDDRAEKIRNFLRDKLATWSIVYVMLIGDISTVPMCPAYKEGPCGWGDPDICWETIDYVPTDYYYAELSLPDSMSWDSHDPETTPTRGEQAHDLVRFPNEVSVGRLPLNDPTAVESICRKMAEYEYSQDTDYKFRYLFASSYFWPDTDGAVTSEYIINHEILPSQIPPVRIYEHETGCYQSTYSSEYNLSTTITKQVWGNQFGDGPFGFVNLIGHGNPYCLGFRGRHPDAVHCPEQAFFCASDRSALNDAYPAMVYGNGCSTAEAEVSNNLPRQLLQRGAVGFIGPTRNALGAPGWTDPSWGSSQSLNYWFCYYAIAHQRSRATFGSAFQSALQHMYISHGWNNDWGQFFEWNFFGNPDMSINPRPGSLPNLQYITPTGWSFPIVPRRTGDATATSCAVSSALVGESDDTFYNFVFKNNGSRTTPTNRATVYLDETPLFNLTYALGSGNSITRLNQTSTTLITGGRHTLWYKLDTNDQVWETNETDNCWGRQFVWGPPLLIPDVPQTRSAPPALLTGGPAGIAYPNCDGYVFRVWSGYPTNNGTWSAVAVLRPSLSPACALKLYDLDSYAGSDGGFDDQDLLSTQTGSAGQIALFLVNGNAAPRGNYFAGVSGIDTAAHSDYRIEATSSELIPTGTSGPFDMEETEILDLYECELATGAHRFILDQLSGTCSLGISVYPAGANWRAYEQVVPGGIGTTVAGGDRTLNLTLSTAGRYAIAVWKARDTSYSCSGTYQLKVGVPSPPATPSDPWPADGATARSVATNLDWADCANATYYRVYMRAAGEPSFAMIGWPTESAFDPGTLEYGTTYDWYVLAYNIWDEFVFGPTWTFTTMTEPDATVITPNGREIWSIGEAQLIEWTSNDCRGLCDILISRNGGLPGTWETIVSNTSPISPYPWTVTGPASTHCRVKVVVGTCTDTSDADFTIAEPAITLTSPDGGEMWYAGEKHSITWTTMGAGANLRIELTRDDGASWTDVQNSTPNDGEYLWMVSTPISNRCRVRISDTVRPLLTDTSNATFKIGQRLITITSPNGGENWPVRSAQQITWTYQNLTGTLRIELSRDAGASWHTLADDVPLASPWTWPFVTPPPSTQCLVRVRSVSLGVHDSSNAAFDISCDVAPDLDGDCDVDWDDWLVLEACMTGPSVSYQGGRVPEGCGLIPDAHDVLRVDFDADGDVDTTDFGVFQRCISGADPADPDCAK